MKLSQLIKDMKTHNQHHSFGETLEDPPVRQGRWEVYPLSPCTQHSCTGLRECN